VDIPADGYDLMLDGYKRIRILTPHG